MGSTGWARVSIGLKVFDTKQDINNAKNQKINYNENYENRNYIHKSKFR